MVDHQASPHVDLAVDLHLEGLKTNTQVVGDHSQGRVEARGKRGAQQIARIGVIVIATDGAVHAKTQRRTGIIVGNDRTVKWIPAA